MEFIFIIAGLVLLFFGGEALLRGSVSLAERMGISKLLVSTVIVGFGTSMPEMTVSVGAALKGSSDIALGNVVGSNIANILLIVGISAAITPIALSVQSSIAVRRDIGMMLFATALLTALMALGTLNLMSGVIMLGLLAGYIVYSYKKDRSNSAALVADFEEDIGLKTPLTTPIAALFTVAGLGLLVVGATLLVDGAVSVSRGFGISEAVIGLTLVAIGTSLPELATSIIAAVKKHSDVVIGNIIGSNLFNILAILGVTSLIRPIAVAPQIMTFDIWVMIGASLLIAALLLASIRISRFIGVGMVVLYTAYTLWLFMQGNIPAAQ